MSVASDEATLRVYRSTNDAAALQGYLVKMGSSNRVSVGTPWGAPIDVATTHREGLVVEVCLAALEPVSTLWCAARDVATRIDRWLTVPVFSLDRDELGSRVSDMAAQLRRCVEFFARPVPTLAEFLRLARRGDIPAAALPPPPASSPTAASAGTPTAAAGAAAAAQAEAAAAAAAATAVVDFRPAAVDSLSDVDAAVLTALKEKVASRFWISDGLLHYDALLFSIAKAVEVRLAGFVTRAYPLIRIFANPNYGPAHWDRINAVVGSKVGPPAGRRTGFFGGAAASLSAAVAAGVGAGPATGTRAPRGSSVDDDSDAARLDSASGGMHTRRTAGGGGDDESVVLGDTTGRSHRDRPRMAIALPDGGEASDPGVSPVEGLADDGILVLGGMQRPPLSAAASAIAAMLVPGAAGLATTAAAVRGPSLQHLIDSFNVDDRLVDLQRISDEADVAAGIDPAAWHARFAL